MACKPGFPVSTNASMLSTYSLSVNKPKLEMNLGAEYGHLMPTILTPFNQVA